MKRWFALALLCMLLAGCGAQPQEETGSDEATTTAVSSDTQPTEPTGCYDPDSTMERDTNGAVKAYPLGIPDVYGFLCMDGDVVIFSGEGNTQLTRLSGDNLYITASASLDTMIFPEDPSVRVSKQGMTYYNPGTSQMVILDVSLKEVSRIGLPDTVVGSPVISEDRMFIYYCTPDAVRVLEMETGIHKLLMEMSYEEQRVEGVWMDGTVLECDITESNGQSTTLFLSTEDGKLILERKTPIELTTLGESYYASYPDGIIRSFVFGNANEKNQLRPAASAEQVSFLEANHGAVACYTDESKSTVTLDYYDLGSGLRRSSLELGPGSLPQYVHFDETTGDVLVMRTDDAYGCETLYRWNVDALPCADRTNYVTAFYSGESPDEAGLASCQAFAQEIGDRYGVEILLWQDAVAVQPWDYTFEGEYQVPVVYRCLSQLDALLAAYPEGMLEQAVQGTTGGTLSICLVRQVLGTPESGSLSEAMGHQFWQDEDAYVVLSAAADMNYQLYHELFHVLEARIFSECTAFYEWEKRNPEGFAYDYDYSANPERDTDDYLPGDTRAFIDTYSMSFPIEDRARIAEYAMNPDNELYFGSEIMQDKLKAICTGIREAFGLEDREEKFLWEQYLREPLK